MGGDHPAAVPGPAHRQQPLKGLAVAPTRDYWPTTGWRTAAPEEHGLVPYYLERADKFAREEAQQISAMLVARHGYVVFERYYGPYGPDSYFSVNSVTKSVLSALVGLALGERLLDSMDQPVQPFFPDADLDGVIIRHILTLTAGWRYRELHDRIYDLPHLLKQPRVRRPGEQFEYDDLGPHLLSAILTRVSGSSAAVYARRELFEALGVWRDLSHWSDAPGTFHPFGAWPSDGLPWKCDGGGISTGGFGVHLTLRDMARFGLLYASGGCWEGRQLIPPNYFEESTRPHSPGGSPSWMPYGCFWWLPVWHRGHAMMAAGWGGQQIYVNADLDLVVAIACANHQGGPMHNGNVLNRYLLPAVQDWVPSTVSF